MANAKFDADQVNGKENTAKGKGLDTLFLIAMPAVGDDLSLETGPSEDCKLKKFN